MYNRDGVEVMEYVYIGKIVNTHGIKGEVRIRSDFKYKNRIFLKGQVIYIGNDKVREVICSYRVHKEFDMITMDGITNINDVLKYKGKNVYVLRDDLMLGNGEFLDSDLIGFRVMVNGEFVGVVKDYIKDNYQDRIVVNKEGKEYMLPFVYDIIEDIRLKEQYVVVKYIKGLLD